ncbi:MAG: DUF4159 domain-containing protein [Pedosphaera sp.]|nr:DUF4159 domain-containing protein [Pedosphaera sp.]
MNRSVFCDEWVVARFLQFIALACWMTFPLRAQFGGFLGGGEIDVSEDTRTARAIDTRSTGTPNWTNATGFGKEAFTFARLRYDKDPVHRPIGHTGGWTTDLPDSDLNLSFRLRQMTSLMVDPDGRLLRATNVDLVNYPFLFASAPGALHLTEPEATALKKYLLNGGFLLMDDFWGEREWANCETVMKLVFPDRSFFELPLVHPLYHGVFEIKAKYQNANVGMGIRSEHTGVTWERPDAKEVHHRGIEDDKGRLMVLTLHNTDTADGWEREGESDYYFHNFSEKIAYPLGVNIIFYAMTH